MKQYSGLLCLTLMFFIAPQSSLLAQKQGASEAQIKAARGLMASTGAENSFRSILAVMSAQITNVIIQQNKGKEAQVRHILNPILADAASQREEMVARAANIYVRKFTIEEMQQITVFYKSPIGRKLVVQLPEIMQESMRIGQAVSQKIGAEIIKRFKAEAKKQGLFK